MFLPCFQWIANPDEGVLVDHVLRLETLEETWPGFRGTYGLPALPSRKNVTQSTDFYTALEVLNSKSISMVNEILAKILSHSTTIWLPEKMRLVKRVELIIIFSLCTAEYEVS